MSISKDCTKVLKEHKTGIVVITGYCTEYCVLSKYGVYY